MWRKFALLICTSLVAVGSCASLESWGVSVDPTVLLGRVVLNSL